MKKLRNAASLCSNVDRNYGANFFIEHLTKFDDEGSIKRIGKIFLKILENTTPTFQQENIELIVRRIYEKGQRNVAEDSMYHLLKARNLLSQIYLGRVRKKEPLIVRGHKPDFPLNFMQNQNLNTPFCKRG